LSASFSAPLRFEIIVYNICLPWALETPHEEEMPKISLWAKIESLFEK